MLKAGFCCRCSFPIVYLMVLSWLEKLIWVKIISISNILTTSVWNSALNLVVIAVHFLFNNLSHLYRNLSVQICCYNVICFTRMRERVSESINKDVKPTPLQWCGTLLISVRYKFALVHRIVNSRTVCIFFQYCIILYSPESFHAAASVCGCWLHLHLWPQKLRIFGLMGDREPRAPLHPQASKWQRYRIQACVSDPWCSRRDRHPCSKWLHESETGRGICCTSCRLVLNSVVAFSPWSREITWIAWNDCREKIRM